MSDTIDGRMSLARWWSTQGLGRLPIEYVVRTEAEVVPDFLSGAYARVGAELQHLGRRAKLHAHSYPGLG